MTSSTQKQTITEHILPNISRSKSNQAMKFSQLIKYNVRNIFLKKIMQRIRQVDYSLSLFFCESFIRDKSKWSATTFYYILIVLN